MQIGLIIIAPVSLLETLFKSTKRKQQLKPVRYHLPGCVTCRMLVVLRALPSHSFTQLNLSSTIIKIISSFSKCQITNCFTWQCRTNLKVFPALKRIQFTSKQQQRQQLQMSCAPSANSVGLSALDGRGWEALLFQELSGPIVEMPLSAHMLDCGSRTSFERRWGDVVASLSSNPIICLQRSPINGKHPVRHW